MMGKLAGVAAGALLLAAGGSALAAPSFTAEVVQSQAGQQPETGRMFMSEQGVRLEFQSQGRRTVNILLPRQGLMRVLFPDERTYFEIQAAAAQPPGTRPETPCPPAQSARCERTGTDRVGSAQTEVWRITPSAPTPPGQQKPSRAAGPFQVWWDPIRRVALREQHADGAWAQMALVGTTTREGRKVEQWQTTITDTDGKTRRMTRWTDPELEVDVREEFPNGGSRELRDIRLVKPDPVWFEIPAGFRRIDPSQASGPASGQAGRR